MVPYLLVDYCLNRYLIAIQNLDGWVDEDLLWYILVDYCLNRYGTLSLFRILMVGLMKIFSGISSMPRSSCTSGGQYSSCRLPPGPNFQRLLPGQKMIQYKKYIEHLIKNKAHHPGFKFLMKKKKLFLFFIY